MFTYKDRDGYTKVKVGKVIASVCGVIVLLTLFFGSFSFVGAGHVGVVTRFGAVNRVVNPGIVFKLPLIEGVVKMETRTQKEQVNASAASKDLQEVKSTVALNFHLRGEKAVGVFQNVGIEYNERIIAPAVQEAFKATTARFTAEELIGKREAVKILAYQELKSRLNKYNIIVDDFNIVNFDFSPEFNSAIEQKQVASQQVETAKQQKAKAEVDAQTALVKAQGQANAQKALKDSSSLTPEYLEFLALQSWDGHLPSVTGGGGTPFVNIPLK